MIIFLIFISACQSERLGVMTVEIYNQSGDMVGTASLSEQAEGVNVKLKLEGLRPGFHGIHVHESGTCEGPDFKSAGKHLHPEAKKHGIMDPERPHLGDSPNNEADADGKVETDIVLNKATLSEGTFSILKGEGSSLVINEEADDGSSQPGGDPGARIMCGEINQKGQKDVEDCPTDPTDSGENKEQSK